MNEFDVIARYFEPLTMGREVLDNDAAVLSVPEGHELVVSTDTLNAGVHFFDDAPPEVIARKALRSNLSDLTASGAEPFAYSLALAFPEPPNEEWLAAFTGALLEDQRACGIYCCGGDTTSIKGSLSVTITVMGLVPAGQAVRRDGARCGDVAIVTGVVGRGFEAFKAGETYVPEMRCAMAAAVREYARAAVDVSDGLIADGGHIARVSGVDLVLRVDDIPVAGDSLEAVTSGDDYEILMAVPADKAEACLQAMRDVGSMPAVIGCFEDGDGCVKLLGDDGEDISIGRGGWQHF